MTTKPFNKLIADLLDACWAMLDDPEDKSVDDVAADCEALYAATKAFHDAFYGAPEPSEEPFPA